MRATISQLRSSSKRASQKARPRRDLRRGPCAFPWSCWLHLATNHRESRACVGLVPRGSAVGWGTMTSLRLGALALCLATVGSALAFGCATTGYGTPGAGGAGGEGGDGSSSGGTKAHGGSKTSGGTGNTTGGRPAIPPATYHGCSNLGFEYDGNACTEACSAVKCDCDPFPSSYTGCHPDRGCLIAVDC